VIDATYPTSLPPKITESPTLKSVVKIVPVPVIGSPTELVCEPLAEPFTFTTLVICSVLA
jgi:hypothetical protein